MKLYLIRFMIVCVTSAGYTAMPGVIKPEITLL